MPFWKKNNIRVIRQPNGERRTGRENGFARGLNYLRDRWLKRRKAERKANPEAAFDEALPESCLSQVRDWFAKKRREASESKPFNCWHRSRRGKVHASELDETPGTSKQSNFRRRAAVTNLGLGSISKLHDNVICGDDMELVSVSSADLVMRVDECGDNPPPSGNERPHSKCSITTLMQFPIHKGPTGDASISCTTPVAGQLMNAIVQNEANADERGDAAALKAISEMIKKRKKEKMFPPPPAPHQDRFLVQIPNRRSISKPTNKSIMKQLNVAMSAPEHSQTPVKIFPAKKRFPADRPTTATRIALSGDHDLATEGSSMQNEVGTYGEKSHVVSSMPGPSGTEKGQTVPRTQSVMAMDRDADSDTSDQLPQQCDQSDLRMQESIVRVEQELMDARMAMEMQQHELDLQQREIAECKRMEEEMIERHRQEWERQCLEKAEQREREWQAKAQIKVEEEQRRIEAMQQLQLDYVTQDMCKSSKVQIHQGQCEDNVDIPPLNTKGDERAVEVYHGSPCENRAWSPAESVHSVDVKLNLPPGFEEMDFGFSDDEDEELGRRLGNDMRPKVRPKCNKLCEIGMQMLQHFMKKHLRFGGCYCAICRFQYENYEDGVTLAIEGMDITALVMDGLCHTLQLKRNDSHIIKVRLISPVPWRRINYGPNDPNSEDYQMFIPDEEEADSILGRRISGRAFGPLMVWDDKDKPDKLVKFPMPERKYIEFARHEMDYVLKNEDARKCDLKLPGIREGLDEENEYEDDFEDEGLDEEIWKHIVRLRPEYTYNQPKKVKIEGIRGVMVKRPYIGNLVWQEDPEAPEDLKVSRKTPSPITDHIRPRTTAVQPRHSIAHNTRPGCHIDIAMCNRRTSLRGVIVTTTAPFPGKMEVVSPAPDFEMAESIASSSDSGDEDEDIPDNSVKRPHRPMAAKGKRTKHVDSDDEAKDNTKQHRQASNQTNNAASEVNLVKKAKDKSPTKNAKDSRQQPVTAKSHTKRSPVENSEQRSRVENSEQADLHVRPNALRGKQCVGASVTRSRAGVKERRERARVSSRPKTARPQQVNSTTVPNKEEQTTRMSIKSDRKVRPSVSSISGRAGPATAKPRPTTVKPQPNTVKPQPTTAEPKNINKKPQPAAAKLQPTSLKAHSTTGKPRPTNAKSQPYSKKAYPVTPRPTTAKPKPSSVKSHSSIAKTRPTTAKVRPSAQDTKTSRKSVLRTSCERKSASGDGKGKEPSILWGDAGDLKAVELTTPQKRVTFLTKEDKSDGVYSEYFDSESDDDEQPGVQSNEYDYPDDFESESDDDTDKMPDVNDIYIEDILYSDDFEEEAEETKPNSLLNESGP